ncbi:serine/threonine-protein kinase, putative [Trypanosoma brucei gambiense DAL972]|uniref:non-specific serine/threonine protein kinase n=1 Tax=Trypanosoma brucei gambiense (strain MHOM/CI/86/DAL972) TaxID=679716 RepID=D0A1D5_TRYB9|nr:serine/threonine-protein kinase, putative [Trypanosoma brucei gambiense DAL972]CBH15077.1 serine/threonine-protein kinase, putative [Trypanosoma brucei gambiense DAL972]|eukprot:XP_011777343.1 serine/threonine-protein kinase, putative [Trypanosoma brucei gambiense DAL972]
MTSRAPWDACTTQSTPQMGNGAQSHHLSGWRRFPRGQQIGSGSFGSVFLSHDTLPGSEWYGQLVAVKVIQLKAISDDEVAHAMNEVAILKNLRHTNVLQYVDSFVDDEQQLCLVTEYMAGGDLSLLLRGSGVCGSRSGSNEKRRSVCSGGGDASMRCGSRSSGRRNAWKTTSRGDKSPSEEHQQWIESFRIVDLVRQCLDGLAHLHECGIIHRDVKPANVYLTESDVVKIGDFGVSKVVSPTDPKLVTFIGTPFYLCPELCLGEPYSFGADIWALGVLTYELYCMKLPFAADNVLAQIHVVTEGQYDREALHCEHTFTPKQLHLLESQYGDAFTRQEKTLHQLVVVLVERMLVMDPMERPSAAQLLREFFIFNPSRCPTPATTPPPSRLSAAEVCDLWATNGIATQTNRVNRLCCRIGSGGEMDDIFPLAAAIPTTSSPLASRVAGSYEELVSSLMPVERRYDVLHISERSGYSTPASSRRLTSQGAASDIADPGGTDAFDTFTQEMINAKISRIPWLRHAEAFSRLSLCEGYDGEVVRVDWKDGENFTLVSSPHKHRNSTPGLRRSRVSDGLSVMGQLALFAEPLSGVDAGSKSMSELLEARSLEVSQSPMASSLTEKSRTTECVITLEANRTAKRQEMEGEADKECENSGGLHMLVGRCRGYSTQTLEAILRKKIYFSYLRRQRKLRAVREAQKAREEESKRLRAELNELYARSYTEKCRHMFAQGGSSRADQFPYPPDELQMTRAPGQLAQVTGLRFESGNFSHDSTAVTKTIDKLAELSCCKPHRPESTVLQPSKLAAEIVRMAADAAAVAARRAEFAAHPPLRLDFRNSDGRSMSCSYSSSVGDPNRGMNTAIYTIPISLYIVRSDIDVSCSRTSIVSDVCDGLLALPMSVALKPIRRRTRLSGIVWRVKEALKDNGLDHVLLFPLDIDDDEQVGAEELSLRYVDSAGDAVVVSEPSDWRYTLRDWRKNMNQSWLQLWMAMS